MARPPRGWATSASEPTGSRRRRREYDVLNRRVSTRTRPRLSTRCSRRRAAGSARSVDTYRGGVAMFTNTLMFDANRTGATVRQLFELGFGEGRLDIARRCIVAGAVDRSDPAAAGRDLAEHLGQVITTLHDAMSDLHVRVDDLVVAADRA